MKVETHDGQYIFEVPVYLNGLDPKAVRVELFADGINHERPVRQQMTLLHPIPEDAVGFIYSATMPTTRPQTDYTARVIPNRGGVAIPLEDQRILWQR